MRAASPLLVLVLLLPTLPAGAAAPGERVLHWDYEVSIDRSHPGVAAVTLHFSGLKGLVDRMGFLTESHAFPLSDVRSATGPLRPAPGGVTLPVDDDVESLSFVVTVNRNAFKAGEYNSFVGPDWGVFKAEAFALGFNYSYLQGTPFRWESTLRYALPPGWSAEMPLARVAGEANAFRLPEGDVLPRGFVAVGPLRVETHAGAGKEFRLATVAKALPYEDEAFGYLEKATPYYAQVYGPVAGPVILGIVAPPPMFRGGLGGTDSFYVHEESDLRTMAHEYAHVWQAFATDLEPGRSSIWIAEGDADYHSALSLFVTDAWSLAEVNEFLSDFDAERTKEPFRSTRLVDATYGGDTEDVAYHKGALVLHALDQLMREKTAQTGEVGIEEALRAINRAHDQRVDETDASARQARLSPVSNEELVRVVNRIVQESARVDFTPFFDQFVYGRDYPAFKPVAARDNLALANLTVAPSPALPGDTVTATVRVENRGIAPATKRIPLFVDGTLLEAREVVVGVGETRDVAFSFPAGEAGEHQVRALYLEAEYRVLVPARLAIHRVATVPETVVTGTEARVLVYVQNLGDLAGEARVSARLDSFDDLGVAARDVPGNLTLAVSFPLRVRAEGEHSIEVTLESDGAAPETLTVTFTALAPDTDSDGVRDPLDAYPENAKLAEKSVGNDVRNAIPLGPLAAAALALAALAGRRRP